MCTERAQVQADPGSYPAFVTLTGAQKNGVLN
jgi:hypothetical protein